MRFRWSGFEDRNDLRGLTVMATCERVLISGAGTVGPYAAPRLAQSGIPVTVFEGEDVHCQEYRVAAWHGVTADMFEGASALLDS